ncbi:putative ABC transporter ATP-binding protein MlaF/Mkl [Helianthus anomalus]
MCCLGLKYSWFFGNRLKTDEPSSSSQEVEDRMPSELSGGMKKRVALARSIIYDTKNNTIEPEVLLYDEPTAGLDPIASTVVEDLIRSVHCKGEDALGNPGKIASYVVVTHQHSTIRRAVDRLVFLHEGKVVWQGLTHEFTSSTNPIVQQFASGNLDGPIRY